MSLSKTVQYIQTYIRRGEVSLSALGFYTYLLSKPKGGRVLKKEVILEALRITDKTLYAYVRELTSIGVLDVTYNTSRPSEYQPLVLDEKALEKFHRKNDMGTPLYTDNRIPISKDLRNVESIGESQGKNSPALELLRIINPILPPNQRWRGVIPKTHEKELLKLSKRVDIVAYTTWFVREKIERCGKTFGWGIFLYPSMIIEFEQNSGAVNAALQTSSKWAGREKEAKRIAAEKLKKLKGGAK